MAIMKNAAALLVGCLLTGIACSLGSSTEPTPTPVPAPTTFIALPTTAPTATPLPTDEPVDTFNPTADLSALIVINAPGVAPDWKCSIMPAIVGNPVNIRSGPDTTFSVIGLLENYVDLIGISGSWYQLPLPGGGTGWVSSTVTQLVGKCGQPVVPTSTPQPTSQAAQCIIATTVSTTSYLLPTFTGGVFTVLPAQFTVQATVQTNDGWFGYDPGIPQANKQGLDRLRWLPAGNPAGNSMIRSPGCQFIPVVTLILATPVTPTVDCIITTSADTLVYVQPNFTTVFGTLPAKSSVKATARTTDGWYGFDPGVAQAGNQGLDRLRWLPAGNPAGNSMTTSAGCQSLTTVSYP